jgi:hypothetical protein
LKQVAKERAQRERKTSIAEARGQIRNEIWARGKQIRRGLFPNLSLSGGDKAKLHWMNIPKKV